MPVKKIRASYLKGALPPGDAGIVRQGLLHEMDALRYNDPAAAEIKSREIVRQADNAGYAPVLSASGRPLCACVANSTMPT